MQDFTLVFKPSVYAEIQEAVDYYNLQSEGLGERFFQALTAKLENLKTNSFYQVRYKNTRMTTIDTFPYVVHFQVLETSLTVLILAVLHGHVNPRKWHS
jgi:plasmid stabilization system protein ParE